MEARGRAHISTPSPALNSILIECMAQRKALVLEDVLHRRMYGAAARRALAYLLSRQEATLSAAEQSQLSEDAVPMMAAWHVFQLLRPHKQTRSIYEMEESEAVHAHRQGLTPSDGREQGKRPRKESEF